MSTSPMRYGRHGTFVRASGRYSRNCGPSTTAHRPSAGTSRRQGTLPHSTRRSLPDCSARPHGFARHWTHTTSSISKGIDLYICSPHPYGQTYSLFPVTVRKWRDFLCPFPQRTPRHIPLHSHIGLFGVYVVFIVPL